MKKFKDARKESLVMGDMTRDVWSGDIVTDCEFIARVDTNAMLAHTFLFFDHTFNCFRRAFWEKVDGQFVLNGWKCGKTVKELLC